MSEHARHCVICGRRIEPRAKWARDWDRLSRCSVACRRSRLDATDIALEREILEQLGRGGRRASICPSDAARRVRADDWRPLLRRARWAANRLCARGEAELTQGGRVVEHSRARGAIRIRRRA